jgi:hypothetical protein
MFFAAPRQFIAHQLLSTSMCGAGLLRPGAEQFVPIVTERRCLMYIKLVQQSELFEAPSRHLPLETIMDSTGDRPAPSSPSFVRMIDGFFKTIGLDFWSIRLH